MGKRPRQQTETFIERLLRQDRERRQREESIAIAFNLLPRAEKPSVLVRLIDLLEGEEVPAPTDAEEVLPEPCEIPPDVVEPRAVPPDIDERSRVEGLLRILCEDIEQPTPKATGRRKSLLADVIYSATMKTYLGLSGRGAAVDLRAWKAQRNRDQKLHYNTVFRYMEDPGVTPLLRRLVEQSGVPLNSFESEFVPDCITLDYKYPPIITRLILGPVTGVVTTVRAVSGTDPGDVEEVFSRMKRLGRDELVQVLSVPLNSTKLPGPVCPVWVQGGLNTVLCDIRSILTGLRAKSLTARFNEVHLRCLCSNLTLLARGSARGPSESHSLAEELLSSTHNPFR